MRVNRHRTEFVQPTGEASGKKGSGSRRIWVIECTERVSLKLLERDREQLWAEAVAMLTKEMRS